MYFYSYNKSIVLENEVEPEETSELGTRKYSFISVANQFFSENEVEPKEITKPCIIATIICL
jgi:hypothetical protein